MLESLPHAELRNTAQPADARLPIRLRSALCELAASERAAYAWQMNAAGMDELGQRRLKSASVLISRAGGLGGAAAWALAAAGVGRLVIAHGGVVQPGDFNRQTLQTADRLGQPRLPSIIARLTALNPRLDIVGIDANADAGNADALVARADVVIDAAPLFTERYALNAAAVRAGVPMIEAAVYDCDLTLTTFFARPPQPSLRTGCLACLASEPPPTWTRQFPVFGATSASAGSLAAAEAIKLIVGFGEPLFGRMLIGDLRSMRLRTVRVARDPSCPVCGDAVRPDRS